ncbi:MAG: hypothetical protein ACREXW_16410, partial [Gammaproteobacteria bacterium]
LGVLGLLALCASDLRSLPTAAMAAAMTLRLAGRGLMGPATAPATYWRECSRGPRKYPLLSPKYCCAWIATLLTPG